MILLSSFRYHQLIYGQHKKSLALIQDISNQLYANASTVGQLIIHTSKLSNLQEWTYDKRYDLDTLTFPYHSGSILGTSVNDIVITFIIGLLGHWDEMYYPISILLKEKKTLGFPPSLIGFLDDLKQNLKSHPYSVEKTAEECRKIDQGIAYLRSHPRLRKALSQPIETRLPSWIEEWKNGDTLYIDLTEEDKEMQVTIIAAIYNYICQVIPSSNAQVPSGIIILEELPYVFYDNSEKDLSAFQLAEWLEEIVRDELRYRNIGIISATFSPNTISPSMENFFQKIVNYWEDYDI